MSHDMFKHIVALNTYTEPFLSMRQNDQRMIIEQLLGITILSEKAENLKLQVKNTKEQIVEEDAKIKAQQGSNEKIESSIQALKLKQSAWNTNRTSDINKVNLSINELEHLDIEKELKDHELLQKWEEHNQQIQSLQNEIYTLESAEQRANKALKKIHTEIVALDDAICYTCKQSLNKTKKKEILQLKQKEKQDNETYLDEVVTKIKEINQQLTDIGDINGKPTTFYESIKEAYDHRQNVAQLHSHLSTLKSEIDPYQDQIRELKASALVKIQWETINQLTDLKDHQEFLIKLLTNKDSFIRKKIIEQNLAYLNNRLTLYLDRLGLPHQVVFKNDLNVEITQLGQDLDFDNLSRGERNRLILGMSFAFRDVWESLYQNVNLLFIDELIDSGMDSAGVENSLSVIKKMGRERRKNIFLISHKDELIGRVNYVMKVIKENGFTSYANDLEVAA